MPYILRMGLFFSLFLIFECFEYPCFIKLLLYTSVLSVRVKNENENNWTMMMMIFSAIMMLTESYILIVLYSCLASRFLSIFSSFHDAYHLHSFIWRHNCISLLLTSDLTFGLIWRHNFISLHLTSDLTFGFNWRHNCISLHLTSDLTFGLIWRHKCVERVSLICHFHSFCIFVRSSFNFHVLSSAILSAFSPIFFFHGIEG